MITRELLELKHKVLLERIDRLYNIFIVLSQDEKNKGKLNTIKVIKEQYEKMYQAILQNEGYDKYEDVENTIMQKLAQIELHLDVHIYKTAPNCEEIIDSYIKQIEKYDNYNNLDGELEKIKALKEILKLYSSYISQEQVEKINYKISAIKFEILLRKQIKDINLQLNSELLNLLEQYGTKGERVNFENLVRERFEWYIDKQLSPDMKETIKMRMESYKERFKKAYTFMRGLYIIEKINKKIDATKILNMQEQIKKLQEQLDEAFSKNQYNKYLEIRVNIIPQLEEFERKIEEIGGLNYILETIISKEYHLGALLEDEEENPIEILEYLMGLYYTDKLPEEDCRYNKAEKMYQLRKSIRRSIEKDYGDDWDFIIKGNPELKALFEIPIFDKSVLDYYEEFNGFYFDGGYAKLEYLSELINGKFSLFDWIAFGNIHNGDHNPIEKVKKSLYELFSKISLEVI